nr:hypothetical protein [Klebsiella michiganensis]
MKGGSPVTDMRERYPARTGCRGRLSDKGRAKRNSGWRNVHDSQSDIKCCRNDNF